VITLWKFDVAFYDSFLEFWLGGSYERLLAKKNGVVKDSSCPNVNGWA